MKQIFKLVDKVRRFRNTKNKLINTKPNWTKRLIDRKKTWINWKSSYKNVKNNYPRHMQNKKCRILYQRGIINCKYILFFLLEKLKYISRKQKGHLYFIMLNNLLVLIKFYLEWRIAIIRELWKIKKKSSPIVRLEGNYSKDQIFVEVK